MIYNPEFNPRFDEDDDDDEEIEAYFCPECPGEMIRLMLPVRNLDTPEEEVIIEYIEREAIRQSGPGTGRYRLERFASVYRLPPRDGSR